VAGRLLGRHGQRVLVVAVCLFIAGAAAAAVLAATSAGRVHPAQVALLLVPALFVAGIGGGSVVTPNQALSLAEVDVRGGSTAGGMLQTSQRIGIAVGAAVISAVFWAVASGAPSGGAARAEQFGRAYSSGLTVSVAFALAALIVAIRDVRRRLA
jgi:hypothetical protein